MKKVCLEVGFIYYFALMKLRDLDGEKTLQSRFCVRGCHCVYIIVLAWSTFLCFYFSLVMYYTYVCFSWSRCCHWMTGLGNPVEDKAANNYYSSHSNAIEILKGKELHIVYFRVRNQVRYPSLRSTVATITSRLHFDSLHSLATFMVKRSSPYVLQA